MKKQITYSSNYIDEVKSCSYFKVNIETLDEKNNNIRRASPK